MKTGAIVTDRELKHFKPDREARPVTLRDFRWHEDYAKDRMHVFRDALSGGMRKLSLGKHLSGFWFSHDGRRIFARWDNGLAGLINMERVIWDPIWRDLMNKGGGALFRIVGLLHSLGMIKDAAALREVVEFFDGPEEAIETELGPLDDAVVEFRGSLALLSEEARAFWNREFVKTLDIAGLRSEAMTRGALASKWAENILALAGQIKARRARGGRPVVAEPGQEGQASTETADGELWLAGKSSKFEAGSLKPKPVPVELLTSNFQLGAAPPRAEARAGEAATALKTAGQAGQARKQIDLEQYEWFRNMAEGSEKEAIRREVDSAEAAIPARRKDDTLKDLREILESEGFNHARSFAERRKILWICAGFFRSAKGFDFLKVGVLKELLCGEMFNRITDATERMELLNEFAYGRDLLILSALFRGDGFKHFFDPEGEVKEAVRKFVIAIWNEGIAAADKRIGGNTNTEALKYIALLSMVIDHVGAALLPGKCLRHDPQSGMLAAGLDRVRLQ